MAINIDRSNNDQFYRYKMPRLVAKVEGSGNGIKTVVANIAEIARSLERPPSYPLKYFGYELGAQTMIDTKNDRFIVNGAHEAGRLQELLDGFIKKFVLCPQCNNPETILSVSTKKQIIKQTCKACGNMAVADMKNKLASYILKNPPTENGEVVPIKIKGKGKARKGEIPPKSNNGKDDNKNNTNGTGKVSPTVELDNPFDIPPPVDEEEDHDDWGPNDELDSPTSVNGEEDLSKNLKALIVDGDADKSEGERLDLFFEFVQRQKKSGELEYKKIKGEVERLELDDKAVLLLVNALFDEHMLEQITQYRSIFLPFVHQKEKGQKFLIGGFETVVGQAHADALMPKCMRIMKAFYDADLLEEEVIVDWFDKPSKKYQKVSKSVADEIRKKVAPFISWLKEAEAESDDDIPVVKSGGAAAGGDAIKRNGHHNTNGGHVNGNGGAKKMANEEEEEEGDDVDIDAI